MILARSLNPGQVGLLLLGIAVVSAVGGVAGFGVNQASTRRIAEGRANGDEAAARATGRTALLLGGGGGALAALGLWLASPWLAARFATDAGDAPELASLLAALAPVAFTLSLGVSALGVCRGFGKVAARALVRDGGGGLLRFLAVAAAAALGGGSGSLALGFSAGVGTAECLFASYAVTLVRRREADEPLLDSGLLALLPPFGWLEVLQQLQLWADVVLFGLLAPAAQVGFFSLARGLARGLDMVQGSAAHLYYPAATAARLEGETSFRELYQRTRLLVLALLWGPLAMFLLAPAWFCQQLFGASYAPVGKALAGLALAQLVDAVFGYKDQALLALGREGAVLQAKLWSALLGVLLLLALAPRYGLSGAVLAVLLAQLVRSASLALLLERAAKVSPLRHDLSAPTGPLLLLGLAVWGLARLLPPGSLVAPALAVLLGGGGALVFFLAARRREALSPS